VLPEVLSKKFDIDMLAVVLARVVSYLSAAGNPIKWSKIPGANAP
jgi:hypothetical protein